MAEAGTKQGFNAAAEPLPQTAFADFLQQTFDTETARGVLATFRQLGLPAPEKAGEFMWGATGGLVFLNDKGLVIRIEKTHMEDSDRVNDSPWVLQPLASLEAGKATIEIIPATPFEADEINSNTLRELLLQEGIKFWDFGARNVGRIPVKTPRFPEGIPVVYDRPSVKRLPTDNDEVRAARSKMTKDDLAKYQEAAEAQENLYAPLRNIFSDSWPETQKMKQFWDMSRRYVREGKLVASWNDEASSDVLNGEQATYAYTVAKNYGEKLQSEKPALSSGARAIPRSPLQPA